MIEKIDNIIERFLYNELGKPDAADLDFSFAIPTKKWSEALEQEMVNIYLLDVKENVQMRKNEWQRNYTPEGQVEHSKPPITLDLYYLISVYTKNSNIEKEHDFFSRILVCLCNFSSLSKTYLDSEAELAELSKKISMELFPQKYIDDHLGFQLWSAIDQNVRPVISLRITAPLELGISNSSALVKTKDIVYTPLEDHLYTLNGRVVYEYNGAQIPVSSALIELKNQEGETVQSVTSSMVGLFSLSNVNNESFTAEVAAEGYKLKSLPLENIPQLSAGKLIIVLEIDSI